MKQSYAIIDLQYGSTGKGLLAGYLAKKSEPDGVVCAFGPNAGHTFVEADGRKWVHVMMPMGALSPACKRVFIGPGAVVHPELLQVEADALRAKGYNFELMIHENAAVVQERHREIEAGGSFSNIGSTQKGTGAAQAEKITRRMMLLDDAHGEAARIVARDVLRGTPLEGNVVSVPEYNDLMDKVELLQIEGAQGFSLSCHHGFYPYVTSRDCTAPQLFSDCAVPMKNRRVYVYGTARTFPIRVNNKTGSSGPCYHDQNETTWGELGVDPELTTVTKLPRRVFTFSYEQIRQATRMSGVDAIFLNFCNYLEDPSRLSRGIGAVSVLSRSVQKETGVPVRWYGWGPKETDIVDSLPFTPKGDFK